MKKIYLLAAILIAAYACSADKSNEPVSEHAALAPENKNSESHPSEKDRVLKKESDKNVLSSSAARTGFSDSAHLFIRTAKLKFRTKNVIQSSFAIEDIVSGQKGYIEHSRIQSDIREAQQVKCSQDSAWKVTKFVTYNTLTARVPVENLDQTLKSLRPLVAYLDYRIVDADNIFFDLFSNQLMQNRIANHASRMETLPVKDQASAGDQLLERQIQSDNALIEDMRIKDKVKFSSIEIYIYQNEEVRKEKVPLFREIEPYRPGFGSQFMDSLHMGWLAIQFIFLLIVKSWSVILLILAGWMAYRRFWKK